MALRGKQDDMSASSLRIIPHQSLGNTAGLARGLTLDMDYEGGVHECRRFLYPKQSDAGANLRASTNGRRKTNLIQPVVEGHRHTRTDMDCLFHPVAQQRKSEKAVGNGAAEGRFALGSFHVQVNPLVAVSYTHLTLPTIYSV